ncbi:MAG TPA: response regulator [Steroidobacteraceae bacterium]|nr:response regulator [Steroidobacteraceae bacterium]
MSKQPSYPGDDWSSSIDAFGDEKAKVLIVDDLPEKLLVFTTMLEELGQDLVCVTSGNDALRELLKSDFAVILLDVNMPDMDGLETAKMIRQHRRSAHTPIIFITAYADELQTSQGYSLGAVDYILSPVVPHILRSKVQVFVQLYSMQRRLLRQADAHTAFVAAEAARRVAEDNDRQSAFLSNASRVLNRSLDRAVAAGELAGLIVPHLASVALVVLLDEDNPQPEYALSAATDSTGRTAVFREIAPESIREPLLQAILEATTGRRSVELDEAALAPLMAPPELLAQEARFPSPLTYGCVLPLLNGDRLLGAILVARPDTAGQTTSTWRVLEPLGVHAAAALENARLYSSLQREIVDRLAAESDLQEAHRRKDEFLAMLSHELRNPLAPIRAAIEMIRRTAPPEPRIAWASDIMARQVEQMTRLIDELLDVARISQGKTVLTRETIDLNAVIRNSIETAQPFIDARRQVLEVSFFQQPVFLHADFSRLSQVVSNLLNNASKYSDEQTTICIEGRLRGDEALICVRDQGIGIDPDLLPRIFDLFAQGRRSLDRSQGGLGVGLTLAQRLAALHGGSIKVHSDGVGTGSEFQLHLPGIRLAGDGITVISPLPAPAQRSFPQHNILVVDDNLDAAQTMAKLLEFEGHSVHTANDGAAALAAAESNPLDVVILDIGLPIVDGYELARRLRQMPATRGALLLAVTGYGHWEDRVKATEAGFDHVYVKPVDPSTLIARIDSWEAKTTH